MSFDPTTYKNWETYLFAFVKRRAEGKCENCKAEDTKKNDLQVHFIDGNERNLSRRNLVLLCGICRPIFRNKYHPGQYYLFPTHLPEWLKKRKDTLMNFNRN